MPFKNGHGVFENQYKPGTIAQTYCHHYGWEWEMGERAGPGRLFGHYHGVESVRNVVEACAELGVGYLTLYAFSTENWERPEQEVSGLMELLVETIRKEVPTLNKNNIRLHVIGNTALLPENTMTVLNEAIVETAGNTGLKPDHGPELQQPLGNGRSCPAAGHGCESRETGP